MNLVACCVCWIFFFICLALRIEVLYFLYGQEIDYAEEQKTLQGFIYCLIGFFFLISMIYYAAHYLETHPNVN